MLGRKVVNMIRTKSRPPKLKLTVSFGTWKIADEQGFEVRDGRDAPASKQKEIMAHARRETMASWWWYLWRKQGTWVQVL
jgi:hypothetical protein